MQFLIALVTVSVCSAVRQALYTRNAAPRGWSVVEIAKGTEEVNFLLALKQRNLDVLTQLATQASDPKSLQYQEYMSISDITALVAPPKEVQDSVVATLLQYGVNVKDIVNRGDAIDVRASVDVASKFFETTFFKFAHKDGKTVVWKLLAARRAGECRCDGGRCIYFSYPTLECQEALP